MNTTSSRQKSHHKPPAPRKHISQLITCPSLRRRWATTALKAAGNLIFQAHYLDSFRSGVDSQRFERSIHTLPSSCSNRAIGSYHCRRTTEPALFQSLLLIYPDYPYTLYWNQEPYRPKEHHSQLVFQKSLFQRISNGNDKPSSPFERKLFVRMIYSIQ